MRLVSSCLIKEYEERVACAKLTCCDAETSVEVVDDGKDGRVHAKGNPVARSETNQRNDDDEDCVKPVDVLVPVGPSHGQFGNVNLGGIKFALAAKRHVVGGAIREGLGLLDGRRRHDDSRRQAGR